MCEIAILDPAEYSPLDLQAAAMDLYQSQGHSLGLVAVYDRGDKLEYDVFRSVTPDGSEVYDFVAETKADEAVRLIIHGRMATHGAVTEENAHPLKVDCPECDIDMVLHNGIVSSHRYVKSDLEDEGHTYSTPVDSETIAHNFGRVPETLDEDDLDYHTKEPAFILLNENAMFVQGTRYVLTDDGRLAHGYRGFGPKRTVDDYYRVILTPGDE